MYMYMYIYIYAEGMGLGPRAWAHGSQGLPRRRPPAHCARAGSPWGAWVWTHGPMGPVPCAQALASGIHIGEVLGWVLGRDGGGGFWDIGGYGTMS